MSDLSRLLDDLYAMSSTETDLLERPELAEPTRAPSWSSEEALDEVFASWVPGPGDDAPAAQRSLVAEARHESAVEAPPVDTWLEDTEPLGAAPVPVVARWTPSDDDILPRRRGRRR